LARATKIKIEKNDSTKNLSIGQHFPPILGTIVNILQDTWKNTHLVENRHVSSHHNHKSDSPTLLTTTTTMVEQVEGAKQHTQRELRKKKILLPPTFI
jgi:dihydrodipicolinate reductase